MTSALGVFVIIGALVVITGMLGLCWLLQNWNIAWSRTLHLPRATLVWIREDRAKARERHKKEWLLQQRIKVEEMEGVEHWYRDGRDRDRNRKD